MSELRCIALTIALVAAAGTAGAQTRPVPPPPAAGQSAAPAPDAADAVPDDIVVEGYRYRRDLGSYARYPTAVSTIRSRRSYEQSERMAKCATRGRLANLARLRAVVDGEFNSARHAYAQDRLKRIYLTCGEGSLAALRQGEDATELEAATAMAGGRDGLPANIDAFPLGHSILDRGAYTIQAIKRYAPGLSLTARQTGDPVVQARFTLREAPRNRFRLPADQRYFEVAVCMVRVEPRLAVKLTMSDGDARFGDVQAALIDRARICVGGARDVQVDPTQFRLYIADAVYRWAVAARNVASLIPTG